jgi:hypothetical protein
MLGEGLGQFLRVVVGEDHGVFGNAGRDAARRRVTEGQQAGAGLDQQAVGMAVVAALELDQDVAAGIATGQANGAHGGFGAGGNQAHHVHRRHQFAEQVGDVDFLLGRRTEGEAIDGGSLHGGDDLGMGVAEDHRAPGADVVGVPLPSASCTFAPAPFWKKQGVPPTERKARTGELTPPGMWRWARSNSCWLREIMTLLPEKDVDRRRRVR